MCTHNKIENWGHQDHQLMSALLKYLLFYLFIILGVDYRAICDM